MTMLFPSPISLRQVKEWTTRFFPTLTWMGLASLGLIVSYGYTLSLDDGILQQLLWSVFLGGVGVAATLIHFDWISQWVWENFIRKHVEVTAAFQHIEDTFRSLREIAASLKQSGFEKAKVIVGIDYTKSNDFTGRLSFYARPLHEIRDDVDNPYQQVLRLLDSSALKEFLHTESIACFGFGDSTTNDQSVIPLYGEEGYCHGFQEVLDNYNKITPTIYKGGPTSLAPIIREAINIVKEDKQHHILFIITDGQVVDEQESRKAVVAASRLPLSIVVIGVGDGPWDVMEEFDDQLPKRLFDNLQFVQFERVPMKKDWKDEDEFALLAMMEVPSQYKAICNLQAKHPHARKTSMITYD